MVAVERAPEALFEIPIERLRLLRLKYERMLENGDTVAQMLRRRGSTGDRIKTAIRSNEAVASYVLAFNRPGNKE